jgi:hypothetical protein
MHKMDDFHKLLEKHLPEVHSIITGHGIHPLLYVFRWCNILFCQEHDLPTLLPIWDYLLSHFDTDKPEELMLSVFYMAIGHLNDMKGNLSRADYAQTIHTLQTIEDPNVKGIVAFANECWEKDHAQPTAFSRLLSFGKSTFGSLGKF